MIRYRGDRRRQFVRGEGCRECYDTGSRGRSGIYEVFQATREMRELINSNQDIEVLRAKHLEQGGTLLLHEGVRLAEEGKASLEEVVRVAFTD